MTNPHIFDDIPETGELTEDECEECTEWFEYRLINEDFRRKVCPSCINKWREKYVG